MTESRRQSPKHSAEQDGFGRMVATGSLRVNEGPEECGFRKGEYSTIGLGEKEPDR